MDRKKTHLWGGVSNPAIINKNIFSMMRLLVPMASPVCYFSSRSLVFIEREILFLSMSMSITITFTCCPGETTA